MKPLLAQTPVGQAYRYRQICHRQTQGQSGFSLVEFLVGSTIGMILLSAAALLWAEYTRMHHGWVQEARLDHDLRASARLLISHLRRAGYWASPASHRLNPYAELQFTEKGILFYTSRDATENHQIDANEVFGIRLKKDVLEFALGTQNWQALTDPHALRIRSFELRPAWPMIDCDTPSEALVLQLVIVAESSARIPLIRRHEALVTLRNPVKMRPCDCPNSPSSKPCLGAKSAPS